MSTPAAVSRPPTPRAACASLAMLAVFLVFAWTAARIHFAFGGDWTALFCIGAQFPGPPELYDHAYHFPSDGYDGQLYRYLAHDPFLQKDYARYMDAPRTRSRRILIPLAAWLAALGRRDWIDAGYVTVEMLFVGLGVYWCARILARRGRHPAWGLLFAVMPATLASFDRMLLDGPLAALFAGFMLYAEEERWSRVWAVAMLAALTRETGLLLVASLVAYESWHRRSSRAAWFAAAALPALAWYGYVAAHIGRDGGFDLLAFPVWGILRRLLVFRVFPDPRVQLLVRVTDILAVLGLAISIALAALWILRRQWTPVTLSVASFVLMGLVLGSPYYMTEAYAFARPVSPLVVWVAIEAVASGAWAAVAAPLAISLSVAVAFGNPLVAVIKGLLGR